MKIGLNIMYFLYAGSHKSFSYIMGGGFLKRILASLYCTKCNEINFFFFFEMYLSKFHIQDHTKDSDILWAMLRNG